MILPLRVWRFFRTPEYVRLRASKKLQLRLFFGLLVWMLMLSVCAGMFLNILQTAIGIDFGDHAVSQMFEQYSPLMIFGLAIILAPLMEELIFRAPMGLFKNSSLFPLVFYFLTLGFAAIHFFNFTSYDVSIWWAPLLVLPQLISGIFLGYIRVKLGLFHAMLLHAAFNGIILGPFILAMVFKNLFA